MNFALRGITKGLLGLSSLLLIAPIGCGSMSPGSTAIAPALNANLPLAPATANMVYALQGKSIGGYLPTASGLGTALVTFNLPTGFIARSLATDPYGQIYIGANNLTSSLHDVFVYAANATTGSVPLYTLQLDAARDPTYIAADGNGRVYVATSEVESSGALAVYTRQPDGSFINNTIFSFYPNSIDDLAVTKQGTLYVLEDGNGIGSQVQVFADAATQKPVRTLTLTPSVGGTDIALDASENLYVLSDSGSRSSYIAKYAVGVSGLVTPQSEIQLPVSTGYFLAPAVGGGAIRVDASGNTYVIVGQSGNGIPGTGTFVIGYPPNATSATVPTLTTLVSGLINPLALN